MVSTEFHLNENEPVGVTYFNVNDTEANRNSAEMA